MAKEGHSRIVGHGLQDGIVKFDGPWDQQGRVRGLGRHSGGGAEASGLDLRENGAVEGFILDIVRVDGDPLGREGSVKFGQRDTLAEVSGDQTQARSRP